MTGTCSTRHVEDYLPDPAKVYLAPEALSGDDDATGILADVFSLGAIAYHLIAGRPPADNPLDLPTRPCELRAETAAGDDRPAGRGAQVGKFIA
jgi:hypothetical protein